MQSNPIKKCSRCGIEETPEAPFAKGSRGRYCKVCEKQRMRDWYVANKKRHREYTKRYAEEHKEHLAVWYSQHYFANRDKYLKNTARIQKLNRKRCNQYSIQWYYRNRAQAQAANERWRQAHKEHSDACKRVATRNRAAKLRNDPNTHTKEQIAELLVAQKGKCNSCGKDISTKYEADHIMPIARGGKNGIDNIQLLCPRCNRRKNAKHPDDWKREIEKELNNR
jgi:hypothetical protein